LGIGGSEKGGAAWQQVLWEVSGLAYQLAPKPVGAELVYAFSPDDFHAGVEHGFRWLANATPLRQSEGPGQERIAAVEDMADGLRFKRLAILRMDVDNLGQLLVKGIPARSMALTSALSAALDRFFIGYLDRMAGQVAREPGMAGVAPNPRAFYVIYAGGDDVFVVCSWRHAPLLALRIREEFRRYCGRDDLGVSAGITLQGVRAPIYRGADASKDALKRAKEIQRAHSTHDKDGVSFLGEVVTWHELKEARRMAEQLYTLVKESGAPKSLLNMLGAVYELWRRDCPPTWQPGAQVIFGPWMWRLAYAVSRFDQPDSSARQALEKMRRDDLMSENSKMHLLGLAVRWAEYLAR
jgi:CRISPR-associated protein Csm1